MVQEISGESEFRQLTEQKGKLVVVDFTASWCGPCKRVAPQYEALAAQHPDVLFLKLVQDTHQELMVSLSVRSFPTFRYYLEGNQVDETRGANIEEVASKVVHHKAKVVHHFAGEGMSLGWAGGASADAAPLTAAEARARRLARFGAMESTGEGAKPDPEVAKRNAKILATSGPADALPTRFASSSATAMDVDPPAAPARGSGALGGGSKPRRAADPDLLSQLMDMGFAEIRAKKGLMFGNGNDLENAVNWIMEHQEDTDIDEPIPEDDKAVDADDAAGSGGTAQSLKCNQCEVLLKDVAAAELHASKTSHSDFSESTEAVTALTPEEKAAKLARMKELIAARRAARGEEEKVDHVKREKARRTMGKEAAKTKEEMEIIARKNAAARAKKEKLDFERERARLKEEIARDKAERKARGGRLSTKLGVDGYKPAAAQGVYGAPSAGGAAGGDGAPSAGAGAAGDAAGDAATAEEQKPVVKQENSAEKMEKAVDMLARQTVAGLGGTAMKTCLAYIKNALNKPEEEKFRSINLDNNAYKNRVASCIGGTSLLKAVGFAKEESRLFMSMEARDEALLTNAKGKLEAAIASYVPTKAS